MQWDGYIIIINIIDFIIDIKISNNTNSNNSSINVYNDMIYESKNIYAINKSNNNHYHRNNNNNNNSNNIIQQQLIIIIIK